MQGYYRLAVVALAFGCGDSSYMDFDGALGDTILPEDGTCQGFDSSTCGPGLFCLDSACEPTRKRKIDVLVESLSAGPYSPSGSEWEELLFNSSDPDFQVDLYWSTDEDDTSCGTSEIESMEPVWMESCSTKIVAPERVDAMGVYGDAWFEVVLTEWDINGWGNNVGHVVGVWTWASEVELDELTEQASMGDGLTLKAGGQTKLYITVELDQ